MPMKADGQDLDALMDGWVEGDEHIYPLAVQYEDTDAAGIVYHANYISYAERGRTALLRLMGVNMNTLIDRGEIEIRDASHLWGADAVDTEAKLKEELGSPNYRVASIGQSPIFRYSTKKLKSKSSAGLPSRSRMKRRTM